MTEEIIYLPPFPMPAKPKIGLPCNGCGWCCHLEICKIGKQYYPEAVAPCPALLYKEGRTFCGIAIAENILEGTNHYAEALGIGKGCCADDFCEEE